MSIHIPVLLQETLNILKPSPGQTIIDATFGGGGHSMAFANLGAKVIALDRDKQAVREGERLLAHACLARQNLDDGGFNQTFLFPLGGSVTLIHENFRNLKNLNTGKVHAVFFDLGISSDQLGSERGFSFQRNSQLDMRFDPDRESVKASDLLNALSQKELSQIFTDYSDEAQAHAIAGAIVSQRQTAPIQTTDQLVAIIESIKPRRGKIHPATQVFQALRIAVNSELSDLEKGLESAWELLLPGGKLLILSFHSGEERIIKKFVLKLKLTFPDPILPGESEVAQNPRSRSAKLRVITNP